MYILHKSEDEVKENIKNNIILLAHKDYILNYTIDIIKRANVLFKCRLMNINNSKIKYVKKEIWDIMKDAMGCGYYIIIGDYDKKHTVELYHKNADTITRINKINTICYDCYNGSCTKHI